MVSTFFLLFLKNSLTFLLVLWHNKDIRFQNYQTIVGENMKETGKLDSVKEAIIFSQRIAQMSKALWKSIEKDWQEWIKPFNLNINEHHLLWIAYHLKGASISEIAKFGVMHVSTAFNFSKKLEERGLLTFSKKENDKRNTYIELTSAGEELLLRTLEDYDPRRGIMHNGIMPIKNVYGKYPELIEVVAIIRSIYGDDFMRIFEETVKNLDEEFIEENGKLIKANPNNKEIKEPTQS